MFCTKCGEQMKDEELFCTKCGHQNQKKDAARISTKRGIRSVQEIKKSEGKNLASPSGTSSASELFCSSCGAKIFSRTEFCTKCGKENGTDTVSLISFFKPIDEPVSDRVSPSEITIKPVEKAAYPRSFLPGKNISSVGASPPSPKSAVPEINSPEIPVAVREGYPRMKVFPCKKTPQDTKKPSSELPVQMVCQNIWADEKKNGKKKQKKSKSQIIWVRAGIILGIAAILGIGFWAMHTFVFSREKENKPSEPLLTRGTMTTSTTSNISEEKSFDFMIAGDPEPGKILTVTSLEENLTDQADVQFQWLINKQVIPEASENSFEIPIIARKGDEITITIVSGEEKKEFSMIVNTTLPAVELTDQFFNALSAQSPEQEEFTRCVRGFLDQSFSGADAAFSFFDSPEMEKLDLSDEDFLTQICPVLLGDMINAEEKDFWVTCLQQGVSRAGVLRQILAQEGCKLRFESYGILLGDIPQAKEAKDIDPILTCLLYRQYRDVLEREADAEGLNYWADQVLNQEMSIEDASYQFLFSQEVKEKDWSNDKYIEVLYQVFLERKPDPEGMTFWIGTLSAGNTREDVLQQFTEGLKLENEG